MVRWLSTSPSVKLSNARSLSARIRVAPDPTGAAATLVLGGVLKPHGACPMSSYMDTALVDTLP